MVKTVTLYKKLLFFFIKSFKSKKKKLVLSSFEISVEKYNWAIQKAYLHRPVKILHFLTPMRIV